MLVHRYDREEGSAMFDSENSFLGDDASFQKKEVQLTKRLVCIRCPFAYFYLCFYFFLSWKPNRRTV